MKTDSLRERLLFEITGGPDKPVIDEGMPETEGIQGGFEGGMCIKVGGSKRFHPVGMVKVKLNRDVLTEKMQEMKPRH